MISLIIRACWAGCQCHLSMGAKEPPGPCLFMNIAIIIITIVIIIVIIVIMAMIIITVIIIIIIVIIIINIIIIILNVTAYISISMFRIKASRYRGFKKYSDCPACEFLLLFFTFWTPTWFLIKIFQGHLFTSLGYPQKFFKLQLSQLGHTLISVTSTDKKWQNRAEEFFPQLKCKQFSPKLKCKQFFPQFKCKQFSPQLKCKQFSP